MTSLGAIAMLFIVAAITPGPNNFVVMRTAARDGFVGALRPVAAIVLGSVALLAAVVAGLGSVLREWPFLRTLLVTGGVLYLAWLGWRLASKNRETAADGELPAGELGLFAFQFANPKGWLMMLTVVAASPANDALATFIRLAPLALCIPAGCLLLWAGLGGALSHQLSRPPVRLWTDRMFGILLIASALPLLA